MNSNIEGVTLKKILFDGGYVDMIGDSPVYMFFIKDHLGSVRAVVPETGEVLQTNEFYPYGDMFGTSGTAGSNGNRYRFTGKELGDESGLYDFSARFLQTSLGRFTTIDPLAEKYPNISPYAYCNGNPVFYVDLTGKSYGDYYSQTGQFITSDGIDDNKIYIVTQSSIDEYDNAIQATNDQSVAIKSLKKGAEEVGGLIVQNRVEEGSNYTLSEFTTIGGQAPVTGYMLEPVGPSTSMANQNKRVPEGLYKLDNYSSEKYPSHFVLYNDIVPKSRAILYHTGNTYKNTRGCMLPGTTYEGNGFVGRSEDKLIELYNFINAIGSDNVRVIVNNNIR
jgi:RHS repeat-associated protein